MAKTTSYPEPRELGLLESASQAAGAIPSLSDYMAAVDNGSGRIIAVWKGTNKRLSLGPDVTQYHVGKVRSAAAARRHGAVLFSARKPGV